MTTGGARWGRSRSCRPYGSSTYVSWVFFFFQAEDGIRDTSVTGVQTCALPIFLLCPSPCFPCIFCPPEALKRLTGQKRPPPQFSAPQETAMKAPLRSHGFDKPRSEERRVGKECRSRWSA